MDQELFSPEENAARRKFHELFCTKYLYTGTKKGALNTDSWNANILWDILQSVHGQTILTPNDIETILQISGMYDASGELYFHFNDQTPLSKTILHAIAPYISTNAFVRGNQELQGRVFNSVATFYHSCCCNLDLPSEKIDCNEVYEAYQKWCTVNGMLVLSNRTFSKKMRECGCSPKKGYLNKKCGVMYYQMRLDRKEVTKVAQQTRKTEEKEAYEFDDRAENEDVIKNESFAEESISREAEVSDADDIRDCGTDVEDNEGDVGYKGAEDTSRSASDEPAIDEDGFDWESGEYVDNKASTGTHKSVPRELGTEVKRIFKQLKISYRLSPESFSRKDFEDALYSGGITPTEELFGEFIKYIQ